MLKTNLRSQRLVLNAWRSLLSGVVNRGATQDKADRKASALCCDSVRKWGWAVCVSEGFTPSRPGSSRGAGLLTLEPAPD